MILYLCTNPAVDKFIWLDEFNTGTINRIEKGQSYPGGKRIHVALGISEFGELCVLLAFLGGNTGKYIKGYCESKRNFLLWASNK